MVDGHLVVFLSRIASSGQGLGFQAAGWAAVRVDDPSGDPAAWAPVPLATPSNARGTTFGEWAMVQGASLYAFGAEDASHAVRTLVRWPTLAVSPGDLSGARVSWTTPRAGSPTPR